MANSAILDMSGLWLGGYDDACNTSQLQKQGVTHILTVEFRPLPTNIQKDFNYKYIHAEDMPDQDLISNFQECFDFIDDALSCSTPQENDAERKTETMTHGGVLVHCHVGFSRSATIVVAYIMQKEKLSVENALESVCLRRSVGPNPGFRHQLELFQMMGFTIDKNHPEFRAFCLNNITGKIRDLSYMHSSDDQPFNDEVAEDKALSNALASDPMRQTLASEKLVFKCRKCRRPLARGTSSVAHPHGKGRARPDTPPPRDGPPSGGLAVDECNMGIFIEPVEWMKEQILMLRANYPVLNAKPKSEISAGLDKVARAEDGWCLPFIWPRIKSTENFRRSLVSMHVAAFLYKTGLSEGD